MSSLRLICTPLGQSARSEFYQELKAMEQGRGVIVLPNRLLQEEAVRNGVECIGIDSLASKILNKNGYVSFNQINRRSQELIVEDLLATLVEQGALPYFAALSDKEGFIKAMTSLVGQLSRSGANQEEINAIFNTWGRDGQAGEKDKEVNLLYQFYRSYLQTKNWFDLEGKYRLAIKVLQKDKVQIPWQKIYFCDFYSFDGLQKEFITALGKRVALTVGLCYEKEAVDERAKLFAAARDTYNDLLLHGFVEETKPKVDANAFPCAKMQLDLGRDCQRVAATEAVQLYSFSSREQEVRWGLTQVKDLLRQGVSSKDILVSVRDLNMYNGIHATADEYGIPLSLPKTGKLSVQPVTELALLLLQAKADTHDGAEAYFKLLTCELGKLLFAADGEQADALRQEYFFKTRSNAQEKVHELMEDDLLARYDQFIENLPWSAVLSGYGQQLQDFVEQLQLEKHLGALYKEGRLPLPAVAGAIKAKQSLLDCIKALVEDYRRCGKEDLSVTLSQWQELLRDAVAQAELTLQHGRQDGVTVAEVTSVAGLQFAYVFLLGVREGEFPKANNENWIYSDRERKELKEQGPLMLALPSTAQSYAEDAYFFGATVAAARKQLVLTFFKDDEAGASPYIALVQRLFADGEIENNPAKEDASPAEASKNSKLGDVAWLEQSCGHATLAAAMADKDRQQNEKLSGILEDDALQQDVRKFVGSGFNATGLEVYAQCPFRYLGEKVWKQSAFQAAEDVMDPRDEGTLLHNVLATFIGRHLQEKLTKYPLATLQDELSQDFAAASAALEEKGVQNLAIWQVEGPRLLQLLQRWLAFEYEDQGEWQGYTPMAVEWDFSSKNGKPLPLKLTDGSRVTLNGRIDRVDSDGQHVFVTDYKRSASAAPDKSAMEQHLDLQLPVYMLAAAQMAKPQLPVGGTYFVLKDSARKSSFVLSDVNNPGIPCKEEKDWDACKLAWEKMLRDYIEGIYQGKFAVEPQKCDAYCALKDICRYNVLPKVKEEGDGANE